MTTSEVLSSRMRDTISAILPKINSTVLNRASPKIDLATAENWLIRPELRHLYIEAIHRDLSNESLSYTQGFGGDPALLHAAANFFNTYFKPRIPVLSDHIVATPGATACLDSVLFSICNEGDSVLVPAPYWNGFDFHFTLRARVKIIPVPHCMQLSKATSDGTTQALNHSLLPALRKAYQDAPDSSRIKGLVVTNPHNPLAQCYPKWVLLEMIQFCDDNNLHYISDELYGMTDLQRIAEFQKSDAVPFISALSLAIINTDQMNAETYDSADNGFVPEKHNMVNGALENDRSLVMPKHVKGSNVHVIWSLSKDFGSSGLRMGFLVSQNPESRPLLASTFVLSTIHLSSLTSIAATHLLSSPQLPRLLHVSASRLRASQALVIGRFRVWRIPFYRPDAGPYITARLIKNAKTLEEQDAALQKINEAGVVVAPALGFGGWAGCFKESQSYGWTRITIAVPIDQLMLALDKIGMALGYQEEELYPLAGTQSWKRHKAIGTS